MTKSELMSCFCLSTRRPPRSSERSYTTVVATIARGEGLRREILAWRDAHQGAYPATLAEAAPGAPTTRMGSFRPPPFVYDAPSRRLTFSMGSAAEVRNDLTAAASRWERVRP